MPTVTTARDLLPVACKKCQQSLGAGEIANRQAVCSACLLPLIESSRWWSRQSVFIEGLVTGVLLVFWPMTVFSLLVAICVLATVHETRKQRRIRRAIWCQGNKGQWHQWEWREGSTLGRGGTIRDERRCSVCDAQANEDLTYAARRDRCPLCGASAPYRDGPQFSHEPSCAGAAP